MSSLTLSSTYPVAGIAFFVGLLLFSSKRPGTRLIGGVVYFLSCSAVLMADSIAVFEGETVSMPDYLITILVGVLLVFGAIYVDYLILHPYIVMRLVGSSTSENEDEDTTVEEVGS